MKCLKCRKWILESSKYCEFCGHINQIKLICPCCGNLIDKDKNYIKFMIKFEKRKFFGSGGGIIVYMDGSCIGVLYNDSFLVNFIEPGEHEFIFKLLTHREISVRKKSKKIIFREGTTYVEHIKPFGFNLILYINC